MPKNVIITPASGLVDFRDASNVSDAIIQLDDIGNLSITNSGGVLSIGNTAANVYIGDGTTSVDVIFEQNGAVRALTGKTLTLGQSDSNIAVAGTITSALNINTGNAITGINLNNNTIVGVNNIIINDSGPNEGIEWTGGNGWQIYESPNDLTTNSGGNLQIVTGSTRRATFNTSGQLDLPVATGTAPLLVASTTAVSNLNADLLDGQHGAYYQTALVSGTTIKTVNGTSVLGSGDIVTGDVTLAGTQTLSNKTIAYASNTLTGVQPTLVSGTTIKTINSTSLLGSGDITISGGGASALTIDNKTAAYTVVAGDLGKIINCTSGSFTVSLTAAATLGAGFNCTIWNTSNTSTHAITIDPNGTEKIDLVNTIILYPGEGCEIICDGTNWQTGSEKSLRGYSENIGNNTRPTASGDGAVAIGVAAIASGVLSFAAGGGTANSSYSTSIGMNSGGTRSQAVTGSGAMALGGSYASGVDSFAAAVGNNTSTYGATQAYAVALGKNAKAANTNAAAIGYNANAAGGGSIVIASGGTGWGSSATDLSSIAIGDGAVSSIKGKIAFASGSSNVAQGTFQAGMLVLSGSTTNSTSKVLNSYNYAEADATNQVILPNNSAYAFTGTIVARQQASGGTASAAWRIEGLIRREGTAASTVLVNSALTVLDNTPGWNIALSADTTNGGLAVTVTGAAATNIRWVATLQTSEVIYA